MVSHHRPAAAFEYVAASGVSLQGGLTGNPEKAGAVPQMVREAERSNESACFQI
jgi:hypothetical protein